MVDPRTQALVTFPVTVRLDTGDYGMQQSISLVLMCQLLETKLLQLLRFRTGGVCLVSAVDDPATCTPPCAQAWHAAGRQACCSACSMLGSAVLRQLHGGVTRRRCQACTGPQQEFHQDWCKGSETQRVQVYTVSMKPGFPATSPALIDEIQGDIALTFVCDPEKAHLLIDQALEEISRLQVACTLQLSCWTLTLATWLRCSGGCCMLHAHRARPCSDMQVACNINPGPCCVASRCARCLWGCG